MQKITTLAELRKAIQQAEEKQRTEWKLMKGQLLQTYTNLQPANLIKKALTELTAAPTLKGNLLDTAMGLVTGYLSKKMVAGETHNPIRQLFGALLQIGVTSIVTRNSGGIRSAAMHLINALISKKEQVADPQSEQQVV